MRILLNVTAALSLLSACGAGPSTSPSADVGLGLSGGDAAGVDATSTRATTLGVARGGVVLLGPKGLVHWGYHRFGIGGATWRGTRPTLADPIGVDLLDLDASENLVCGRDAGGQVFCFGGDSGPFSSDRFVGLAGVDAATAFSVGGTHACALQSGGTIACWGRGSNGQLGNGFDFAGSLLVRLGAANEFDAVEAGARGTCARRSDGSLSCWGDTFGETPQLVFPGESPDDFVVGGSEGTTFVCARFGEHLRCNARLSSSPSAVVLQGARDLAVGSSSVCATKVGGGVMCWGGSQRSDIMGLPATAVLPRRLGSGFGCALDGADVYCWGVNDLGQLGQGDTAARPLNQAYRVALP